MLLPNPIVRTIIPTVKSSVIIKIYIVVAPTTMKTTSIMIRIVAVVMRTKGLSMRGGKLTLSNKS
jgi:hypothetical protein